MYLQSKFSNKRQSADKFQLFASLNFNLLGCTLSSLLKWEPKKYLRRPLLNLHPAMIDQAVIANRLIVGYMSRSAEEEEKSIYCSHSAVCEIDITQVSKLLSIGCQRPEECGIEIRDEIYCQLIKETTGNTSRRSCFRGYQLILSCLAGFPPSDNLAPLLLTHLLTGCQGGAMLSRRCVRYAENCVRALELIQESGSRQCGLTRHEIITILSGNSQLTIKVWLTDEFAVDIAVDSWTTVRELKLAACSFVGIKDTSILTINAISSSVDQLGLQADTDNLASSRRVISILFDQLYHHHSILATAEFNTMRKGRFQSLFGSTKHLKTSDVASRALYTLDTNLKIEFTGTTDGALNASESFFFSEHIEKNQDGKKMKPALNLQSGLFELKKSLGTSISSVKVDLKLCLRLWIFPYHTKCEDYSYPRDSLSNKFDGEKCMISNYIGTDDKTHCEDAPDFFMAVNPGNSGDGNKALYWPSEEPTRNILFAQLIKSVADGTLECVEDIESLRLAALMFAEQHQQEHRPLQSGLPSILLMQETVLAHLDDALPPQLTSMAIVQRVVSGSTIKSKLRAILGDADSTANDGFGFGSFPNIVGLDCLERTARAGSRGKFGIRTHCPRKASQQEIQSKYMKERDEEPDWADDMIWLEFLSSVIVRLWLLHLDTLTAKECRDEYLLAARSCSGYGICKFYAARAKMSILTLETVNDTLQSSDFLKKGKNREDNTSIRRRSSSIRQDDPNHDAKCVPIERLYACNTSSKEMNGSTTSTIALQLSIDADGISLIERKRLIEKMDSVNSRSRNNSVKLGDGVNCDPLELSCKKDLVLTYLLLSIKIDDIISWGYSDVEFIIHFKQREGNHEDSYYSNDDDEEDNPSLQNCHKELEQSANDWRGGLIYHQNSSSDSDDILSSVSTATTVSGCPVQAKYHHQRHLDKLETSRECRVQDLPPLRQCVHGRYHLSGELEINNHKRKEWLEQNVPLESSVCDLPISVGETKEIDPYCSPFRSDTSSDLNEPTSTIGEVASKRPKTFSEMTKIIGSKSESRLANVKIGNDLIENATIDNKERMEKIHSIWNDSISLELQYGMEIAELLEAYCRRRNFSKSIVV